MLLQQVVTGWKVKGFHFHGVFKPLILDESTLEGIQVASLFFKSILHDTFLKHYLMDGFKNLFLSPAHAHRRGERERVYMRASTSASMLVLAYAYFKCPT